MATYYDDEFSGTLDTIVAGRTPDTTGSDTWAALLSGSGTSPAAEQAQKLSGDGCVYRTGPPQGPTVLGSPSTGNYRINLYINVKSLLASDSCSLSARVVDGNNYYLAGVRQDGSVYLNKLVANASTNVITLAAGTVNPSVGNHVLSAVFDGNNLSLFWDGTQVGTTTVDSTYPATNATRRVGLRVGSSTSTAQTASTGMQITRFEVTDVVAAPVNGVAPAVTGTATSGQPLTCSTGTWTGSPTSYAYQWKLDGSNITGQTSSTYGIQSGDVGHAITCTVTATNGAGSTSATSNSVTPSSGLPVNSTAPAITTDGTPQQSETVTTDNGAWTNAPTGYSIKWQRSTDGGTSWTDIAAQTSASYQLQFADVGNRVRSSVAATNSAGTTAYTPSSAIQPAAPAAMVAADIDMFGSGASNIGGAIGSTAIPSNFFPSVPGTLRQGGGMLYRCLYVKNKHGVATLNSIKAYIAQQFTQAGMEMAVGWAAEAKNTQVAAVANQATTPPGVTFTTATTAAGGQDGGNLGPGEYRGIWLRYTIPGGIGEFTGAGYTPAIDGTPA